eukprot:4268440-Pleurochrysis_carterae.AAC.1
MRGKGREKRKRFYSIAFARAYTWRSTMCPEVVQIVVFMGYLAGHGARGARQQRAQVQSASVCWRQGPRPRARHEPRAHTAILVKERACATDTSARGHARTRMMARTQ